MAKEKRPLNPAEAYRRTLKNKAKKQKAAVRKDKMSRIPVDRHDPYQLIAQIQKYDILEYEDKLTGEGRSHRKRLVDQFNALRKARANSGLETVSLPKFDAEAYEALKEKTKSQGPTSGGMHAAIIERMVEDAKRAQRAEEAYDPETGLPCLPPGEPPFLAGIPGLPPYKLSAVEQDPEPEFQTREVNPDEPRVIYSAPAAIKKVKRDKLDDKVDSFLNEIYNL